MPEQHHCAEAARLAALHRLDILDTPAEERFDRYTRLAAAALRVPIAAIVLVDAERQWFKSRVGLDACATPRSISFCSHAILRADALVVPDARLDERFAANPLVSGAPGVRAYAGQCVRSVDGAAVGTLCVIDTLPREFTEDELRLLSDLAALVQEELNRDLLARARSEHLVRAKEQLLDAVLESVDVGVIACDAQGDITLFNRAARKLHNLPPGAAGLPAPLPDGSWFGSDQLRQPGSGGVLTDEALPLRRALLGECVNNFPIEVAVPDMKPRLALVSGRPLAGPDGARLGAVVAIKDVTDLAESRGRIVESEERLRTIADNVPALIAYIGPDLRYRFANERYADWLGLDPAWMLGRTVEEAMGEMFYAERRAALQACMAGSAQVMEGEVRRYGHSRVIRSTYIPHLRSGEVLGAYVFSTDMTAAREHERQLHALAHTDHLTGLPNRRAHEERLAQAIERAHRGGGALALACLDIDHFKQINDTLGHGAGDAVLREFGQRLAGCVRVTDAVARLAGDEFVIVLEQVHTSAECTAIGRKLLDALRPSYFVEGRIVPVTASIGIGWSAAPERRTLAEAADRALYRTKEAGRDGVSVEECPGRPRRA